MLLGPCSIRCSVASAQVTSDIPAVFSADWRQSAGEHLAGRPSCCDCCDRGVCGRRLGVGWVNTSQTARETQRMADAVQLTTQFTTATEQLGSSSTSAQLGAVLAVDQLIVTDPTTYTERDCLTLRGFVITDAPRNGQQGEGAGPNITEALAVLSKRCLLLETVDDCTP